MKTHVVSGLQVLRRAAAFLESDVDVPAKLAPIAKLVEQLHRIIDRLSDLAAEQVLCDRGYSEASREAQDLARSLLCEYVRPVVRLGKLVFAAGSPLRSTLKSPDEAVGYVELMVGAAGMAERLEEHRASFVAFGLGEDFVDRIRGAIAALEQALARKADFYGRRSAATSGLNREFARGRDMMRVLDTMVAPRLKGTQELAQWRTLSRFIHRSKREQQDEGVVSTSDGPVLSPQVNLIGKEGEAA